MENEQDQSVKHAEGTVAFQESRQKPSPELSASNALVWRVNTPGLLREILDANPTASILEKPLNIFGKLLAAVGERAAELSDPKLNALMCRLAIYSISDPNSPDYNEEVVMRIIAEGQQKGIR